MKHKYAHNHQPNDRLAENTHHDYIIEKMDLTLGADSTEYTYIGCQMLPNKLEQWLYDIYVYTHIHIYIYTDICIHYKMLLRFEATQMVFVPSAAK